MLVACEQALHYLRESREVTQEQHAKGDASARGGERKGELATISHKFSFPPRKPSPLGRRLICWLPNSALK